MCSQNAANAISGIQILKIFWEIPPDPPTNLMPSALAPQNFTTFPPLLNEPRFGANSYGGRVSFASSPRL
jgi:hypothetical protein